MTPLDFTPPQRTPPSGEALSNMVSEIAGQTTAVINTVVDKAKELDATAQKNVSDVLMIIEASLGKIDQRVGEIIDKITSAAQSAPPVDAIATFQKIAQGITSAEQLLNKEGGLMISGGKVEVLITVQIPGTPNGASSRVEFQITPKPIT